jgi:hypothetical protein
MRITGSQIQQLHRSLLSTFNTHGTLAQMVRFGLDENLDAIATGNLSEVVFGLIGWAEAHGRIKELVEEAQKAHPNNPDLLILTDLRAPGSITSVALSETAKLHRMRRCLADLVRYAEKELAVKSPVLFLQASDTSDTLNINFHRNLLSTTPIGSRRTIPATDPVTFNSAEEALEAFDYRLLLLGEPGSGKTTTLLSLIKTAADRRLQDPHAPLPIPAPLHKWNRETPLQQWLKAQQESIYPGLDVSDETPFYILDGLDEVETLDPALDPHIDPRALLATQLSDMLVEDDSIRAVVTCRAADFSEIGGPLEMTGAVCLLPLHDDQIRDYLLSRQQHSLWNWVHRDPSVMHLLRIPLLLGMFSSIAYDAIDSARIEANVLTEFQIFNLYVENRFRHESQQNRFSNLRFDIDTTHSYLGKIAARMWESYWTPEINLSYSEISQLLDLNPLGFLRFAISMNLVREENGVYSFLHSRLRDYFAVPVLLETAVFGDWLERPSAIKALGQIGNVTALPTILELINDGDLEVRGAAITAAGQIKSVESVPSLIESLHHEDEYIRILAADALGEIAEETAVPALEEAAADPLPQVREGVIAALGSIGAISGFRAILNAMNDENAFVRTAAVEAIGVIGGQFAILPLTRLASDEDVFVRQTSQKWLSRLSQNVSSKSQDH